MPKGSPKPTTVPGMSGYNLSEAEWLSEHTAERDVSDGEPLGQRVEGKVASGTLGVVVSAHASRSDGEVSAGGHKGALAGGKGRTTNSSGDHGLTQYEVSRQTDGNDR